jgi:peptidyl-prolyl cis-trans isomerase A (cyclophilin A)
MTSTYKRIGLFVLIYVLAFALFKFRAHAQTPPATPPAEATAPTTDSPATTSAPVAPTPTTSAPAAPVKKPVVDQKQKAVTAPKKGVRKMYAEFDTSMGKFKAVLFHTMMPITVDNFVGLVEGKKQWTDPASKALKNTPFYNGLTFHRIIKGFMIQGGDPVGNGTGGPGYKFDDEFHPNVNHNKQGILSMANAGPNTNGSQFFITLAPQPGLDQKPYHYNAFGEVIEGFDIVKKIGDVKTDRATDKPVTPVTIKTIKIIREY